MKKTIVLLGLILAAVASPLFAQDTLQLRDMRLVPNLYVYGWPDTFKTDPNKIYEDKWADVSCFLIGSNQYKEKAVKVFSDDSLEVFGIAACVTTMIRWNPAYYEEYPELINGLDTSLDNSSIFFRIYEADEDSLRYLGDEQEVHMLYTPVSYYVDLDLWDLGYNRKWPPLPVYERYFSSPITVMDSFYVGLRSRSDHQYNRYTRIGILLIANGYPTNPTTRTAIFWDYQPEPNFRGEELPYVRFWYYDRSNSDYYCIFPIIAPPDTTGLDDTTGVGVEKPDMVYRYTSVAPNPATDRVRVTSSFGLQDIVAYNEAGSKVYEGKASGMVATLDVSTWPRGAYLLRITTPMGTTVKKLLVQ